MLDLSLAHYDETTRPGLARTCSPASTRAPGVQNAAALVADLPLDGGRMGLGAVRTPGLRRRDSEKKSATDWNVVSPGAFKTLEMQLMRGRDFTGARRRPRPARASSSTKRLRARPGDTPEAIGRTVEANDAPGGAWQAITIVGVAADAQARSSSGTAPSPTSTSRSRSATCRASRWS